MVGAARAIPEREALPMPPRIAFGHGVVAEEVLAGVMKCTEPESGPRALNFADRVSLNHQPIEGLLIAHATS